LDFFISTSVFNLTVDYMTSKKHHIIPLQTYFLVFSALMVLTALTVLVTYVDLGSFNIVLAMFVAILKATLVLLFFMHLYYDNKTNLIFFISSVIFLIIFIVFTLIDINYRKEIYDIEGVYPYESYQDLNGLEKIHVDHHDDHSYDQSDEVHNKGKDY
tara:strand:- start:2425 stop:2898 length:474 start_codon:yes stop_codon:yes gene_type:complete